MGWKNESVICCRQYCALLFLPARFGLQQPRGFVAANLSTRSCAQSVLPAEPQPGGAGTELCWLAGVLVMQMCSLPLPLSHSCTMEIGGTAKDFPPLLKLWTIHTVRFWHLSIPEHFNTASVGVRDLCHLRQKRLCLSTSDMP